VVRLKYAISVAPPPVGKEHVGVTDPTQSPPQPANVEPVAAVAVRVMRVPFVTRMSHVDPQFNPPTSEVTVPVPAPPTLTVIGVESSGLHPVIAARNATTIPVLK
jgi:hypothetical protein